MDREKIDEEISDIVFSNLKRKVDLVDPIVDYILANFVEKGKYEHLQGEYEDEKKNREWLEKHTIALEIQLRRRDKQEGTLADHKHGEPLPYQKRGKIEPLEPIVLLTLKKLEDKVNEIVKAWNERL